MGKTTKDKGDESEEIAAAYLESLGWVIMDRNYFFQRSEVDIVAYDKEAIVFVEVKSRSTTSFGHPEDFVDEKKIKHIYKAADAWMYERKMEGAIARFDVISIVQKGNQAPDIKHFKDAFR